MQVITCECGQKMKVPPELVGKTSKCVRCGAKLKVTESGAVPAENQAPNETKPPEEDTGSKRIGELLIGDGLISEGQLREALKAQKEKGGKTFQILLSMGYLEKGALHDFLSRQSGVPAIDLRRYEIPTEIVALVPKEFAREHLVLPIDKMGRLLTVGMACPLDDSTIAEVGSITGLRVKAMLCKLDDILGSIERYYPSPGGGPQGPSIELSSLGMAPRAAEKPEEPAAPEEPEPPAEPEEPEKAPRQAPQQSPPPSPEEAQARLMELDSLPTLSDAVQRLRAIVEDPNGTIVDVAAIVKTHPSVAAEVLRVANAAAYGLPGEVESAGVASALLGVDGICEVVMRSRILDEETVSPRFDYRAHAADAVFCAIAAEAIAVASNGSAGEEAYTAGLLLTLGRLALAAAFPERVPMHAADGADHGIPEEEIYGMAYPEAGYLLAQEWGLPEDIGEAIRHHRNADAATRAEALVTTAALAALMADIHGGHAAGKTLDSGTAFSEALGLDGATAQRIFSETADAAAARQL